MKECKRVECMGNNGCIDKCWKPQRTWIWLTAQEVATIAEGVYGSTHHDDITFGMEIQNALRSKND